MGNDLISRKAVAEFMFENRYCTSINNAYYQLKSIPAVYDLESVIDTLEKYKSQQSENEMLSDNGKWLAKRVIKECIKIIKSGTTATNGKNGG